MDGSEENIYLFEYFNIDVNLLTLQIINEGFQRGQNVFTLDQFIKGDYWKIDEIEEEIRDANDYGSVEDLVLHQIIKIVNDVHLGKLKRVSITSTSGLLQTVVEKAVKESDASEENIMNYTGIIEEIYNLRKIEESEKEKKLQLWYKQRKASTGSYNSDEHYKLLNRIDFNEYNFGKHFQFITAISAPYIEFEIDFNEIGFNALNEEINNYILNFYKDEYISNVPFYREKRQYFSKQVENFVDYIKRFPVVENCVNVPFSSLSEQGFEVIKIIIYLEIMGRAKVRNWNDKDLWNIRFQKTPITVASIFGQEDVVEIKSYKKPTELKLNLSFHAKTGIMEITDQNNKKYKINIQGQVQKDVLRVIFRKPEDVYTQWSLYDISIALGGDDVDTTAVKNAIYQFNKKVQLTIPEVDKIFELSKHSAMFNPKYVNKT